MTSFRERHSRSPRVLHIGNIANNAYNNAKLLIEAGFECDVLCYDYYHIMACPEWEDADFENTLTDDFHPNWRALDLRGFIRPKWFVQGPSELCLAYLHAKNSKQLHRAARLWRILGIFNLATRSSIEQRWTERIYSFALAWQYRIGSFQIRRRFNRLMSINAAEGTPLLARRLSVLVGQAAAVGLSNAFFSFRNFLKDGVDLVGSLVNQGAAPDSSRQIEVTPKSANLAMHELLHQKWAAKFPVGCYPPSPDELSSHPANDESWISLFKYYDFVIGYSTDSIYPMMAGIPYLAFEHGTLRHIPYEDNVQGRLAAASYHEANHVLVTNFDCVASAKNLVSERYTFINHPFDDEHGQSVSGGRQQRQRLLRDLDADMLFFFPTRQDWVEGTGYADKANDVFFEAMASLRAGGLRVGVVCCNWGRNVAQSRELIAALGLTANVEWVQPLPVIPFERMCQASDIVADQFKLGAFGGVVFKAMAVGAPILTYLNQDLLQAQYPVLPPVINCRTAKDIVEQVSAFAREPALLNNMGWKSKEWISTHHSKKDTVNVQVSQFRKLLSSY